MNGDREKIAIEITKTSESIRKKYRALKTGKMEVDVALERQFKPITEPLKQHVEKTVESDAPKIEPLSLTFGEKHEEKRKESKQGIKRARINMPINDSPIYSTLNRSKRRKQFSNMATVSTPLKVQPRQTMPSPSVDEIYETTPDSFVTSIRHDVTSYSIVYLTISQGVPCRDEQCCISIFFFQGNLLSRLFPGTPRFRICRKLFFRGAQVDE